MQHSNLKGRKEPVTVFSRTASPVVKVYKINEVTLAFEDITPAVINPVNIYEDYYKWTFITPNENCFVYVQWGETGTVIRVGSPRSIFFLIAPNYQEHLLIPFKQISFDGVIMQSETLIEIAGLGLYYALVNSGMNESFISIDGKDYTLYDYINMSGLSCDLSIFMDECNIEISSNSLEFGITMDICKNLS